MERAETLQNIATARQYCEMMDTLAERITSLKEKIENEQKKYKKKKARFKGPKILLLYVVVTFACFLPMAVLSFLVDLKQLGAFVPLISAAATIIAKIIYESRTGSVYGAMLEQVTKPLIAEMESCVETVMVNSDSYDKAVKEVPEDLRYTLALDFIHEAVRQGYRRDITDAAAFYRERLQHVYANNTSEFEELKNDIEKSRASMESRCRMISEEIKNTDH